MHSVKRHWVGRRQLEWRDLTAQIAAWSNVDVSRSQRNLGHFYWLNFDWLQNLLVYSHNSHNLSKNFSSGQHKQFPKYSCDTFLYTISFLNLEGIAIPSYGYPRCNVNSQHQQTLVVVVVVVNCTLAGVTLYWQQHVWSS